MMSLETIINDFCNENNLIFGIATAEKMSFDKNKLENIPFVNYSIEERLSPKLFNDNINSVIVLGIPYYKNKINFYNEDYHIYSKKYLDKLIDKLSGENYSFVDTGALFERGFALKCGLGFRGKNTSVINGKLGSYFNIGYILSTEKLEPTISNKKDCIGCNKCINSCPTKSLGEYQCNAESCISYLTQKKAILTIQEMKSIGQSLYGCEICQQVCPHNKFIKYSERAIEVDPLKLLDISKKEFNKYRDLPFYWRGLNVIKRNALIYVYNSDLEILEKIEILEKFTNSQSDLLKATANILLQDLK